MVFFQEINRINTWHNGECKEIPKTAEESLAGFDEIGMKFGFEHVIMTLANNDLTKVKEIRGKYLHDCLRFIQMRSFEIAAKREYQEIIKRKNK